jgi:AAA15 family ATPase/GTPase
MLKRFEVENFKCFEKRFVFNLDARDYEFNKHLIRNGIVNKAIIYGKNGIGKSNLGIALFDIVSHLTDKEKIAPSYLVNYCNLNHPEDPAIFVFHFQFDKNEVIYEYAKHSQDELVYEKLKINGKDELDYNYFDIKKQYISEDLKANLNISISDNKLSVLKYIYRNTPTNTNPLLTKIFQFCENMLWYRSLSDGNNYSGFTNGGNTLTDILFKNNKLEEFNSFLKKNGMDYNLKFENINGREELLAVYHNNNKAPFNSVASTGTKALFLFYTWNISAFSKISFLFIDEFDAFFHYESAENIVKELNNANGFQSVLTTHNTYLMKNELTRPDCCFIMTPGKITSLCDATDKEIREGHNLEKMYVNGAFQE